jgi:hypothetical protein
MIGMAHREQIFRLLQQKMFEVQAVKGRDYGEEQDGLRNLRRRGVRGVLGRMEDKMIRLDNLIQPGREVKVQDESIEDTLIDLANYSLLLIILMWDEKNKLPELVNTICTPAQLVMRKLDEKHLIRTVIDEKGFLSIEVVKSTNGVPIPDEEPVILFRGRDRLALPMLKYYYSLCEKDGATLFQLTSMTTMIQRFGQYAIQYPEVMKQPGVTLGK